MDAPTSDRALGAPLVELSRVNKHFGALHVLQDPQGGPDNSTLVMSQQLFRTAFTEGKFGYASAMGVAMAIVTLVFAALVFTVNRLAGGRSERGRG